MASAVPLTEPRVLAYTKRRLFPESAGSNSYAVCDTCPSSVSPHAFRRGSITHHLNSDVPETAVGDRANVSQEVLGQHYDQRSKRDKMQQRRKYLNNI